jgi:hypothetical protein
MIERSHPADVSTRIPAGFLIGPQREFCRAWPNQQQITIKGAHFLREDSPNEVGEAIAPVCRVIGIAGVAPLRNWTWRLRCGLSLMFVFTASAHWGRQRGDLVAMVPVSSRALT